MIDARKLAAQIIDDVESAIHDDNPWILDSIIEAEEDDVNYDQHKAKGNTLLYGDAYYLLEDELTRTLQDALDAEKKFARRRK